MTENEKYLKLREFVQTIADTKNFSVKNHWDLYCNALNLLDEIEEDK